MKKITKLFRNWRYRRLYRRLLWLYVSKTNNADEAGYQAATAFQWITGYSWTEWFNNQISQEAPSEDKAVD